MVDEDFEVVEIPLAVIAPGPGQDLLDIRVLALCFTHGSLIERPFQGRLDVVGGIGKLDSKRV